MNNLILRKHNNSDCVLFRNPHCLQLNKIFGFIMNIPNDYHIGYIRLPLQRKHWIAIRKINERYYNLDSKLKEPLSIGNVSTIILPNGKCTFTIQA